MELTKCPLARNGLLGLGGPITDISKMDRTLMTSESIEWNTPLVEG